MKNYTIAIASLVMPVLLQIPATAQMSHEGDHGSMHTKMHEEKIEAVAVINSIDTENHKVNVSHEPIPALSWPAMTMDFSVSESVDLEGLETGSSVTIVLAKGEDGIYMIQEIKAV